MFANMARSIYTLLKTLFDIGPKKNEYINEL